MKYNKFSILTTVEAEDILAAELMELGVEGVEIEDNSIPYDIGGSVVFYDELPEIQLPKGIAYVNFYMDEKADRDKLLSDVNELLQNLRGNVNIGDGSIAVSSTEDADWLNRWKDYFHQFTLEFEDGKRALFIPSWEEPEIKEKPDFLLHIDPGMAFGTGAHETTRLCVKALEKYIKPGDSFLDIGTGSGILSMMAFIFGAGKGTALDLDTNVEETFKENFRVNGLTDKDVRLFLGDIITDEELRKKIGTGYDVVLANILPVVLTPLTPIVKKLIKPDGYYIVSGILTEKGPAMRELLEKSGFEVLEEAIDGEWMGFSCVATATNTSMRY